MSKEVKQLIWLITIHRRMLFLHQEPEFLERPQIVAEDPATACVKSVKSEVQKVHAEMVETIQCSDVITWNEGIWSATAMTRSQNFKVFHQYMRMVMDMMLFILVVRKGD